MLLWSFADNTYGYYQMLRWVIAGATGYSAYLAYKIKDNWWVWVFGIIAILFNPIAPIHLSRGTWSVIDLVVAVIIIISLLKNNNKK